MFIVLEVPIVLTMKAAITKALLLLRNIVLNKESKCRGESKRVHWSNGKQGVASSPYHSSGSTQVQMQYLLLQPPVSYTIISSST